MEKDLYIDATHPNEIRVVLKSDNRIEDYEYEGLKNSLIKNNIYLVHTWSCDRWSVPEGICCAPFCLFSQANGRFAPRFEKDGHFA